VVGQDTTRYPVENVSWEDAVAFSKKLSDLPAEKAAGRSYRLPTEAEWEYAARAGTRTVFPWGDSLSSKQANFDGKRTTTVGSYAPNPWGLYDTAGNVWEWCADWYATDYYAKAPASDPAGPSQGTLRDQTRVRPDLVQEAESRGMSAFDMAREWASRGRAPMELVSPATPRVIRGGSGDTGPCKSAQRHSNGPGERTYDLGLEVS